MGKTEVKEKWMRGERGGGRQLKSTLSGKKKNEGSSTGEQLELRRI